MYAHVGKVYSQTKKIGVLLVRKSTPIIFLFKFRKLTISFSSPPA